MARQAFGPLEVDLSHGCGGVWFDRFELEKIDEQLELLGNVIAHHLRAYAKPLIDTQPRLNCPRDTDVVMMRRYFSVRNQIEIDECPACGGIWLDAEELDGIRALFNDRADYEKARSAFLEKVLDSDQVRAYQKDHDQLIEKMERVSSLLWKVLRLGID